jgi:iron complex outermembrane recepter protein
MKSVTAPGLLLNVAGFAAAMSASFTAFAQEGNASGGLELEEIVVTAQKREQNVERVPITVTALTADALEAQGATDTSALSAAVPGLQMNRSFRAATPFIRGVGNPAGALGDEGAVAFYVDGVYQTNLIAELFSFNNIERIEVLKGPQGTLFGRNALGGVIQVITREPDETPRFDVSAGYGNYSTTRGSLYATGKVATGLTADIAMVAHDQKDGWGTNLITGNDVYKSQDFAARSKWVWKPGDATKLTFSAQYDHGSDYSTAFHLVGRGVSGPASGDPGNWNVQLPSDPVADVTTKGVSLKAEQDIGALRLINTAAYGNTRMRQLSDLDAQPANIVQLDLNGYDRSWNDELQLMSAADAAVDWVVGFFYLYDKTGLDGPVGWKQSGAGNFNRFGYESTKAYAGYAQATASVLTQSWPGTHITAGVRYSSETRGLKFTQVPSPPTFPVDTEADFSNTNYRIAFDHQFTDDMMAYISYATGFKSGLYNTNAPTDPPVRPETVGAFEAGVKTKWFERRLLLDASVFHYGFKDIQLRKPTGTAAGTTSLLNAAEGRSQGLDVTMQTIATQNLSIQSGFEFLSTKYTSFPNYSFSWPNPATCVPAPGQSTGAPTGGNTSCFGDATGKDLIQSPHFTGNFGARYTVALLAGEFALNAMYSYTASFAWEADNRLKNPAHGLVTASVNWTSPDKRWEASLWGKNLTNAHYYFNEGSLPFGDIGLDAPPRTFGVDFSIHLGD